MNLKVEYITLDEIQLDPRNSKNHPQKQIKRLCDLISKFGFTQPLLIREENRLIAGECRLMAARTLKHETVPCIRILGLTDDQARALAISDNKIGEMGTWNEAVLAEELRKLEAKGIEGTTLGFNTQEIRDLLAATEGGDPRVTTTREPAEEAPAIAQQGDILELVSQSGRRHQLYCGNSTNPRAVKTLMNGHKAQLVFTDPPYGVDYQSEAHGSIEGDKDKGDDLVTKLLMPALKRMVENSENSAAFYIWHASATRRDFEFAIDGAGLMERQYLTWVKPTFVLGHADYHWQTEPCFYCYKSGHSPRYIGDRKQSTVWRLELTESEACASIANGIRISDGANNEIFVQKQAPKTKKMRLLRIKPGQPINLIGEANTDAWEINLESRNDYIHPTQKPVELAKRAIENHLTVGESVMDLFAGSGSTLIAAEITATISYSMELDPKFINRIARRWLATFEGSTVFVNGEDKTEAWQR